MVSSPISFSPNSIYIKDLIKVNITY